MGLGFRSDPRSQTDFTSHITWEGGGLAYVMGTRFACPLTLILIFEVPEGGARVALERVRG